jgi:choline dehydrogenase-like flavoprotein
MASECYDVIIVGTGGGTLAYRLSPSAKPILRRSRVRNHLAITARGIGLDQLGNAGTVARAERMRRGCSYWRRYLALEGQSEWASRARRSLKFCEMQRHLSA